MSLKDPQTLLQELNTVREKLRQAEAPLSQHEQRAMADALTDVYNYVSAASRKSSLTNYTHTTSAHDARVKKQLEEERQQLEMHRKFVEDSFDKADQYLRTIQMGGYAAFFAVWGVTRDWLTPSGAALAAILMTVSATTFIVWEMWRSTILSLALKTHASISGSRIEEFVRTRMSKLIYERATVTSLAQSRASVWLVCVLFAALSLIVLVWQLLGILSNDLFL